MLFNFQIHKYKSSILQDPESKTRSLIRPKIRNDWFEQI